MLVIGLMSGTSADGTDAALVEWPDNGRVSPFKLLAHVETPFEPEFQRRVHALAGGVLPGPQVLAEFAALDVELGERFAKAALGACSEADVAMGDVACIASHGQTVAHHPELRATLQIGDPSVIAERTGCTTIADFRTRDMALGGQGAPLAPFFHHAAFGSPDENRIALNLGGIANITWLPRSQDPDAVIAFDTGPANSLVDGAVAILSGGAERMDRNGARATNGQVDAGMLSMMLDDAYLAQVPPKSTGREHYGASAAQRWVDVAVEHGCGANDLVATLVAFTAKSVALACLELLPAASGDRTRIDRVVVGGGGASNPAIMAALNAELVGIPIERFSDHGVPVQAAEAMAFSLMGRNALLGIPNHLPQCTGASRAGVLGEISAAQTAIA
ncbi:MAG: anhydro-N-acetylmuramic acid kinase [Myxococcota bacterium]